MAKRIGELLVDAGYVTREQVKEALALQQQRGGKLCHNLINLGYLTEETLLECLANQPGMTSVSLEQYAIDSSLRDYVPKAFAYGHEIMPLDKLGKILTVAMAVPLDEATKAELEQSTGLRIRAVLCGRGIVRRTIEQYYGPPDEAEQADEAAPAEPVVPGPDAVRLRGVVEFLDSVDHFPLLLDVHARMLERLADPDVTVEELAALVEQDPTLAANLLKVANSAAYALRAPFDSVQRAVVHLGLETVGNIVVGFAVLSRLNAEAYFDLSRMFHRAYTCGILTKLLCAEAQLAGGDTAFTAGLLANLGPIAMRVLSQQRMERLAEAAQERGQTAVEVEEDTLGVSASEIGYHLAQRWNLSETLTNVIRFHDRLDRTESPDPLAIAVALANACLTLEEEAGDFVEAAGDRLVAEYARRIGLPADRLEAVASRYREALDSMESLNLGVY